MIALGGVCGRRYRTCTPPYADVKMSSGEDNTAESCRRLPLAAHPEDALACGLCERDRNETDFSTMMEGMRKLCDSDRIIPRLASETYMPKSILDAGWRWHVNAPMVRSPPQHSRTRRLRNVRLSISRLLPSPTPFKGAKPKPHQMLSPTSGQTLQSKDFAVGLNCLALQ